MFMAALQKQAEILWPPAPPDFSLGRADVHVWAVSLAAPQPALAELDFVLTPEERQRAARFRFERERDRFVAGRGRLRTILAGYLKTEPGKVQFVYGPQGKPALANSSFHVSRGAFEVSRPLEFNLAHSGNLALLAVTHLGPIGIDVEQIRPIEDSDELVARFFSPR